MEVKIPQEIAEAIGEKALRPFEVEVKGFAWKRYSEVDLREWSIAKVRKFLALCELHQDFRGGKVLVKDLKTYIAAYESGTTKVKARKVTHFYDLLLSAIYHTPGHRVYMRNDENQQAMLAFYVKDIVYHPEQRDREYPKPETVVMHCLYESLGGRLETSFAWTEEDCVGCSINEVFLKAGIFPETPELRAQYVRECERFAAIAKLVGKEYTAKGIASDDLDDVTKDRDEHFFWGKSEKRIRLEKAGQPVRVIVDVFRETDTIERERTSDANLWFWSRLDKKVLKSKAQEEADLKLREQAQKEREKDHHNWSTQLEDLPHEDEVEERPTIEVPIHPFLAVYDKSRDKRIRVHVNYLTEYVYDRKLIDKLVLPVTEKDLVKLLAEHKLEYKDIVAGKSNGIVVLCKGPPGTGKTLTAEVLSESEARPLVAIQAANLGLDAEQVANRLAIYLRRVQRWNGILLINEADIYCAPRGNDLVQNAICGAFLETIEYSPCTVFLTTNREVDDAVASRCIARIDYDVPGKALLPNVWRILSETAGLKLSDKTIAQAVDEWPHLSGRDVKNLLALAQVISNVKKTEIDFETLRFVKHFKPTADVGAKKET
jgi:hypothetical protein